MTDAQLYPYGAGISARDGLDAKGYIETRCAVEKIPPALLPVLDASAALLESIFKAKIHGIYLYGSVATGEAVLTRSDIDILVIFVEPPTKLEHAEIKRIGARLSESYLSLVREVGIVAASLEEALAPENLAGLGCFLKHLCVCVAKEDVRGILPKFRPTMEVARGFNGDYARVMQAKLAELAEISRTDNARAIMRQISRKTVRTGFSLVMPRANCWTTELEASADYFCLYYPEQQDDMLSILKWCHQATRERAEFLRVITPFAEWLANEFDRVIGK